MSINGFTCSKSVFNLKITEPILCDAKCYVMIVHDEVNLMTHNYIE